MTVVRMSSLGPIFVVGVPRSGTTLAKACLNRHSRIHMLGETRFFLTPYSFRNVYPSFSSWIDIAVTQCFSGIDPSLTSYRATPAPTYRQKFNLADQSSPGAVFYALLEGAAADAGKDIGGEKSPLHFFALQSILREYPGARVVFVLRDYRAVRDSVNQRKNFALKDADLIALYRLQQGVLARYADRVLAIQYVDLCNRPEPVLREVCNFIGVPFEAAMLRPGMNNSSRNQALFSDQGKYTAENPELGINPAGAEAPYREYNLPRGPRLPVAWAMLRRGLRQKIADLGLNLPGAFRARRAMRENRNPPS